MNIKISNLNISIIERDLQRLFTPFGEIGSIEIDRDKLNNRSKGRAFITMPNPAEAKNAIEQLHGSMLVNKKIDVVEMESMQDFYNRKTNF